MATPLHGYPHGIHIPSHDAHRVYEFFRFGRDGPLEAPVSMAQVDCGTEVAVQLAVRLGCQRSVCVLVLKAAWAASKPCGPSIPMLI